MIPTLVLQKETLDDLFLREDEFKSFIKFLKKNFRNYNLIINHIDDIALKKHSIENPLIEILLDKIENITFLNNLEIILLNNEIGNYCSKRSIIICNLDDNDCNSKLEKTGLLYFNLNNLNKWELFNEIVYSKSLKVSSDSNIPTEYKFINWSDITKYMKYCNSIIIFDKHIFVDKSNQKIKNNLFKLLENILNTNKNYLQITIISEFENDDILKYHTQTKLFLNNQGLTNFNLNLIHHTKAFYPRNFEGLHSRFILTNYLHILSNDSFNFFKENGRFNNLADIELKFNLTTKNKFSFEKDLENIKTYILKTKNEPNSPNLTLKCTYFKNKNNCLLN